MNNSDTTTVPTDAVAPRRAGKVAAGHLVPTASTFDFLEGEYLQRKRTRQASRVLQAITLLLVAAAGFYWFQLQQTATEIDNELLSISSQLDAATTELAEIANVSASEEELTSHLEERLALAESVTANEVDYQMVVGDMYDVAARAGVQLTSVSITPTTSTAGSGSNGSEGGGAEGGAASGETEALTVAQIKISGTAPGLRQVSLWEQELTQVPYLREALTPFSSGQGQDTEVTFSTTGVLTGQAKSDRVVELRELARPGDTADGGQTADTPQDPAADSSQPDDTSQEG